MNALSNPTSYHALKWNFKMLISLFLAAFVTLGLLFFMHSLVDHDLKPQSPIPAVSLPTITFVEPESKIITREPAPVKPEIPPPPQAIRPTTTQTNNNPSLYIESYTPAKISNTINVNLGKVDAQPRPLFRASPRYPDAAARQNIEGHVVLRFDVSTTGEVINVKTIESYPSSIFNREAIRALKKWRYQPKIENEAPVQMNGLQVKLDFTLSD